MHDFLIVKTTIIPEWTKKNVPFYSFAPTSNDGLFILMDDAHPISTYQKWLGPNFDQYEAVMAASVRVTTEEFKAMRDDQQSVWYAAPEVG